MLSHEIAEWEDRRDLHLALLFCNEADSIPVV